MKDTQWWNCSLFRSRYSGRWQRFTLVIRQWRKGANRSSRYDPWHERAFALPLFRKCSILSTAVFVPLWSFPVVIPNLENVICVILITIFSWVANCFGCCKLQGSWESWVNHYDSNLEQRKKNLNPDGNRTHDVPNTIKKGNFKLGNEKWKVIFFCLTTIFSGITHVYFILKKFNLYFYI